MNIPTILTPDQKLRVFVSSTLQELSDERRAARSAIEELRLSPVMFELGARPHPPRNLYRAYLEQSHIFVGIYWQRYGWVAPKEDISGLEDEYRLCGSKPKLIYVKAPAPDREERLKTLLKQIQYDDDASYRPFASADELRELLENDLALLLTERFTASLGPTKYTVAQEKPSQHVLLPVAQTELIGREREVEEVAHLLMRPHTRLVTLQGPGGVGKSRLGLEAAQELSARFRDGVVFVPLSPLTDPDLLIPTVADAFEVREVAGTALKDALITHLQEKEILLLLDNFEHLESAGRELRDLLAAAPGLKLLVTSRSTLHISAEHVYEVRPLDLPRRKEGNLKQVYESSAVQLFEARAKAVKPSFSLTSDNMLAVTEICWQLDGLPLAIELAAAYLRLFSPQALLQRLGKRFDLLKSGARDLPDRQQTLRNTIAWSYNLLSEPHRTLFTRLGVFAGGFSFEAAEVMSGETIDILEGLTSLIDKSLVRSSESEGEPYFVMLESIQAYAEERLKGSGTADQLQELHASYFLELAQKSREELAGPNQSSWIKRLELEHPNFRVALAWLIEAGDFERAAQLAYALTRFWMVRGHIKEGRDWLSKVRVADDRIMGRNRVNALVAAAVLADEAGDLSEALHLHEANIVLCKALGERRGLANSLTSLAGLWYEQEQYERSRAMATESLAVYRELGDAWGESAALNNLSVVENNLGNYELAQGYAENALAILRGLGDEHGTASPLINLGALNIFRGDYQAARERLVEALTIYANMNDERNVAYTLELMARVTLKLGMAESAARLLGAAASLRQVLDAKGSSSDVAEAEKTLKAVRQALGDASFETAWARGRALSLDKALKLAASEIPKSGSSTYP